MAYDPKNPQAFPRTKITEGTPGMSLRDWFAGQAISGMIAFTSADRSTSPAEFTKQVAKRCYALADAMLKARES